MGHKMKVLCALLCTFTCMPRRLHGLLQVFKLHILMTRMCSDGRQCMRANDFAKLILQALLAEPIFQTCEHLPVEPEPFGHRLASFQFNWFITQVCFHNVVVTTGCLRLPLPPCPSVHSSEWTPDACNAAVTESRPLLDLPSQQCPFAPAAVRSCLRNAGQKFKPLRLGGPLCVQSHVEPLPGVPREGRDRALPVAHEHSVSQQH